MASALTGRVKQAAGVMGSACEWDSDAWRGAESLRLDHHMGKEPAHRPTVEARLLHDAECLHVVFRVRDRWVRSVVTAPQGMVCTDSCVELFFTPGPDTADGYFNIEVNCGGTALFHHQVARNAACRAMTAADIEALAVRHTMPAVVEPEIGEPVEWLVRYRVPYAVLAAYAPVTLPSNGTVWRANLYKCADNTSHPHWLTWSPVEWPAPDFHRPEFFGTLVFEE